MDRRTAGRLSIASCVAAAALSSAPTARVAIPPLALSPSASTRLLVIAPHPDDEALAAAGLMLRVIAGGGQVTVVIVTSGDAFVDGVKIETRTDKLTPFDYRGYGQLREAESAAAMAALGVDRGNVRFLGFPDEGLCLLASRYLGARGAGYESPYTERARPPLEDQVIRGVRYRGDSVRRELERLIVAIEPTYIAAPHPEDDHPDHCAAYIFLAEAITELERSHRLAKYPHVLHYLVHYDAWPPTPVAGNAALAPPTQWRTAEGRWRTLPLTSAEAARKNRAIEMYASQMRAIGGFLRRFERDNELFVEGRPASLPECWCDANTVATEVPPALRRRAPRRP